MTFDNKFNTLSFHFIFSLNYRKEVPPMKTIFKGLIMVLNPVKITLSPFNIL